VNTNCVIRRNDVPSIAINQCKQRFPHYVPIVGSLSSYHTGQYAAHRLQVEFFDPPLRITTIYMARK